MVDFHAHVLPGVDDGAKDLNTSLQMLHESRRQGVSLICATPHFYADQDDPRSFLERRNKAWRTLRKEMAPEEQWPNVRLGAEVLFFPGISGAEEMKELCLEGTPFLLIEPPMRPWTEAMLEEIEECGRNLKVAPVIAHVDRYMRMLRDDSLLYRLKGRRMFAQVNASFFLRPGSFEKAMQSLREGRIHFIGSDCHDQFDRAPDLGRAAEAILAEKDGKELLRKLNGRVIRAMKV